MPVQTIPPEFHTDDDDDDSDCNHGNDHDDDSDCKHDHDDDDYDNANDDLLFPRRGAAMSSSSARPAGRLKKWAPGQILSSLSSDDYHHQSQW